ncbi:TetR/AcrR family transcriptional regulator [Sediminibacillus albus]|uniref:WHG domain-containing protein n=1 Tax=Sediminibacillus albus TaxID=407036 RepID=A0A1G8X0H1_9BACI|nr:TetR/AcrR family transcriptional regulator [Sediminibacillus albus]SDJ83806.1 WHG domain-containing protein [Sediminibacillus albus]
MAPRKAVNQELTREIIMEAARTLFVTDGYRNVSIRKIAAKLGYSHGSIYYHFQNKAELFYALVERDFSALNQKLDEILAQRNPADVKLQAVLIGFIEFGLTHQNHYEIMFLTKDEEIKSFLNQGPNKSYEKFANALQTLSEKTINVQTTWSVFLMLHGFVAHYCQSGQQFHDVRGLAESYVNIIFTSMLAS